MTASSRGNSTNGPTSWGRARIYSEGYVSVSNSILRNNYTTGSESDGGTIFARGDVTLNDSQITHNHTTGLGASVGGVRSNGKLVVLRSTVSDNWNGRRQRLGRRTWSGWETSSLRKVR